MLVNNVPSCILIILCSVNISIDWFQCLLDCFHMFIPLNRHTLPHIAEAVHNYFTIPLYFLVMLANPTIPPNHPHCLKPCGFFAPRLPQDASFLSGWMDYTLGWQIRKIGDLLSADYCNDVEIVLSVFWI